ncbi:hypothetical protein GCM10008983_15600 [Lentibacillus halophilus]|uniref:Uncharacterized protein n=1 Tax=Lentibacillus halophilus TaxID=295065 RepID=A0ABP3J367_9BACI
MAEKQFYQKKWVIIVTVVIIVIGLLVLRIEHVDEQAKQDQQDTEQTEKEQQETEQELKEEEDKQKHQDQNKHDTDDKARGAIKKQLQNDLETLPDSTSVRVQGRFDHEPYTMEVIFRGVAGSTKHATVTNMKTAILQTVCVVSDSDYDFATVRINVMYPSGDSNEQKQDQFAIKSEFSEATINKLADHCSDIDMDHLKQQADRWWQHPVLSDD